MYLGWTILKKAAADLERRIGRSFGRFEVDLYYPDGVTDDTVAIQAAYDDMTAYGRGGLIFGPKTYTFDTIRLNPAVAPGDPNGYGRCVIEGRLPATWASARDTIGTQLVHKDGSANALFSGVNSGVAAYDLRAVTFRHLLFVGGTLTTNLIYLEGATDLIRVDQCFMRPTANSTNGLKLWNSWNVTVDQLRVFGPATGAGTVTGVGVLVDNAPGGGTANQVVLRQVNTYKMGIGVQIGHGATVEDVDATEGAIKGPISVEGGQASHSDSYGLLIGGGVRALSVNGFHTEFSYREGVVVTNKASGVSLHGGTMYRDGIAADRHAMNIGGDNAGTGFTTGARNVEVRNYWIVRCPKAIKVELSAQDVDNVDIDQISFSCALATDVVAGSTVTSATVNTITDATKAFDATYIGKFVRLLTNTGAGQTGLIIAVPNATTLQVSAGSGGNWAITPDNTTTYAVGTWMTGTATAGGANTISDTTKNFTALMIGKFVRLTGSAGASGNATAGSPNTITDNTRAWQTDMWAGRSIAIVGGTGQGTPARIVQGNTGTVITVTVNWATPPDGTSVYAIGNTGAGQSGVITAVPSATQLQVSQGGLGGNWAVNPDITTTYEIADLEPVSAITIANVATSSNILLGDQFLYGSNYDATYTRLVDPQIMASRKSSRRRYLQVAEAALIPVDGGQAINVAGLSKIRCVFAGAQTITNLQGGFDQQMIVIHFASANVPTLQHANTKNPSGQLRLAQGLNFKPVTGLQRQIALVYNKIQDEWQEAWRLTDGQQRQTNTKTGAYAMTAADDIVFANNGGVGYDVTLPDATTCRGHQFTVIKSGNDGFAVTIKSAAGTINGVAAGTGVALAAQYNSRTVVSDGTNWLVLAST